MTLHLAMLMLPLKDKNTPWVDLPRRAPSFAPEGLISSVCTTAVEVPLASSLKHLEADDHPGPPSGTSLEQFGLHRIPVLRDSNHD